MKHFRAPALLIGALAAAALVATSARARTAAFSATYTGTATEKVNGQIVSATAKGKGVATVIGKSTMLGTVTATTANPPCSPFKGPGVITAKAGKLKVNVLPTSRGCAAGEDDQDNISLNGTVKVKGGTGKYRAAKGTWRFTGHYNRANGSFSVKLRGTLTF